MKRLLVTLIVNLFITGLQSQDVGSFIGKAVDITTTDGNFISGDLISIEGEYLILKTEYGENRILKDKVKDLKATPHSNSGDIKDNAYSGSHYYLAQSAFNLKKGQLYYENLNIFFNSFAYGVTDNFMVSGGFEIISLINSRFPVTYITPKFSLPFSKGAFSISTTIGAVNWDGEFNSAGFLQGALTLGTLKDNFTIGTGVGYTFEEGFADALIPLTLSGMVGVSNRLSLLTENWILLGDDFTEAIISLGVRIHSRQNQNFLTLSLIRPTEDTGPLIAWPVVSGTISIK